MRLVPVRPAQRRPGRIAMAMTVVTVALLAQGSLLGRVLS